MKIQQFRRLFLRLAISTCALAYSLAAGATWSIIIIDPKTKAIGVAAASCTYSVYGIASIVPGKGAIVVQAMSNPLARMKGVSMIRAGAAPAAILAALKDPDFDPEKQQYAIVCAYAPETPFTYTGADNHPANGALTGSGLSVQGNTLASADVLQAAYQAAEQGLKEGYPLAEVLMLALEAGARMGGDKRCGERTASSAFITVVQPNDNHQKPHINLVVTRINDSTNAVVELRQRWTEWQKQKQP